MGDTYTITQTLSGLNASFLPYETGHITLVGGVYTRYNLGTGSWIGVWPTSSSTARAYTEWDISSLGDSVSTVTLVKLLYYCIRATGNDAMYATQNTTYRISTSADDSATNGLIWGVLGSSPTYVTAVTFPVDNVKNSIQVIGTSGATVCHDITSQATLGWFSLGYRVHTEAAPEKSEYLYNRDPDPTLYVEYDAENIATLNKPSSIVKGFSKETETYRFRDGSRKIQDVGTRKKTLTLSGTEHIGGEESMATVDIMLGNNHSVVISGFDDDSLNDTWYITDFSWRQNAGFVDVYEYTISFEKE